MYLDERNVMVSETAEECPVEGCDHRFQTQHGLDTHRALVHSPSAMTQQAAFRREAQR